MSGKGPQREKTLKVLVIGATGRVGSEVVKALLQRGAGVRAFSRKQPKPGAFSDAVEVALSNLNDPVSVAAEAMKGADKLFLLIGREGVPVELTQAVTAYGLAKRAGLKHVTFVSVFKADQFIEVPHFANTSMPSRKQPGAQRFDRGHRGSKPVRCAGEFFHLTSVDRFDQRITYRKWRYKVPAPTPACFAISSRLAAAPWRVKAPFATSRIRSRLRRASFAAFAWQVGIVSSSFSKFPATGDYLRLSTYSQTVSDLIGAAAFRQFRL
jgi:hypothetical protein